MGFSAPRTWAGGRQPSASWQRGSRVTGSKHRESLGSGGGEGAAHLAFETSHFLHSYGQWGSPCLPRAGSVWSVAYSRTAGLFRTPLDSKQRGTAKSGFICLNWMGFLQRRLTCADVVNGAFPGHKQCICSAPRLFLKQRRMQREKKTCQEYISQVPSWGQEHQPNPSWGGLSWGEGRKTSGDSATHSL